mgnify:CR=1 FL=1
MQYFLKKIEHIAFFFYIVLVFWMISCHEPWFDEAQAWLLARDLSFPELFWRYARYEGSPSLWHAILMLPAQLGLPYQILNIISGFFSVIAVYLLIFRTSLPIILRVIMPFTFFFAYQYSVVARSYCLLAPLLLVIGVFFESRFAKPKLYAFALLLLANVSIHGMLIAGCLLVIDWKKWVFYWRILSVIFSVLLLNVFQLIPPKDINFAIQTNWKIFPALSKAGSMLIGSFGGDVFLAASVIISSLFWFWQRGVLAQFCLPIFALGAFFGMKYGNVWHEGSYFLIWVFALVLSFNKPVQDKQRNHQRLMILTALLLFFPHLTWSYNSYKYDYQEKYTGAFDIVQYIKKWRLQRFQIVGQDFSICALEPYFKQNIFVNLNRGNLPAFWHWSFTSDYWYHPLQVVLQQVELVIIGQKGIGYTTVPGYKEIAFFPGGLFWKDRILENDSYLLLGRDDIASKLRRLNAKLH